MTRCACCGMSNPASLRWLDWARRLQAIAQTGLTYTTDPYDQERFRSIRQIAAEMLAAHSEIEPGTALEMFSVDAGHATPKVDVRAAVFRGESVLLVRERSDGAWTLPGGWADPGEPPSTAVVREVREESGYETRALRLLALLDRDTQGHPPAPFYAYKLFFECELLQEGLLPENVETDEAAFFDKQALPTLSLARVTPVEIARLFHLHKNPHLPADFD